MRLIRPAAETDAAAVADIYRPIVENTIISFEIDPPDEAEIRARMAKAHRWLVCEENGRILGYAYSGTLNERAAYRWSAEVSVYVAEDARGKGVGRALVEALIEDSRSAGFVNVFAGVALPNSASVTLFENLGFKQIALQEQVGFKLDAWHDVGWWQLKLLEGPVPPPPR